LHLYYNETIIFEQVGSNLLILLILFYSFYFSDRHNQDLKKIQEKNRPTQVAVKAAKSVKAAAIVIIVPKVRLSKVTNSAFKKALLLENSLCFRTKMSVFLKFSVKAVVSKVTNIFKFFKSFKDCLNLSILSQIMRMRTRVIDVLTINMRIII